MCILISSILVYLIQCFLVASECYFLWFFRLTYTYSHLLTQFTQTYIFSSFSSFIICEGGQLHCNIMSSWPNRSALEGRGVATVKRMLFGVQRIEIKIQNVKTGEKKVDIVLEIKCMLRLYINMHQYYRKG